MKAQITIATAEGERAVEGAYSIEGSVLFVHRSPFNPKGWSVTHGPTGFNATGKLYSTRRMAILVAKAMIDHLPEVATKRRVKTFLARNKRKIRHEIWRCEQIARSTRQRRARTHERSL